MRTTLQAGVGVVLVLGTIASGTGCRRHVGSLALVSTTTPQYELMASAPMSSNIPGKDSRLWLLILPLDGKPTFEEAVDRATTAARGDFMVNARFYRTFWTILLLTYESNQVIGDVGNSKGAQPLVVPSDARPVR